jgi:hypothetical protein
MKRSRRIVEGLWRAILAAILLNAVGTAKPPAPAPVTMPGGPVNRLGTRWVAPYVFVTHVRIDQRSLTSVRWFGPDGKLKRELSGPSVEAQPGFAYDYGKGQTVIHAVNGDWQFVLPKKPGSAPYITSTEDSHVFVHQFHPKDGQIAVDLYAAGKWAGTVGPFVQYLGRGVQVADDGSIALVVWKDEAKKVAQVVAAGTDGKIRVKVDCDGLVDAPKAAPDGAGVLVQPNTLEERNTWSYYTAKGKVSTLSLGPNAHLVCWLPGTTKALCSTAIGSTYRFHLIDWATGTRLWATDDPNGARTGTSAPQVIPLGSLLLFAGLEEMDLGGRRERVRSLQAVEVRTSQVVARWHPRPLRRFEDGGRFVRLGERLYLVADDEFTEIRLGDIGKQKNGWR